MSQDDAEVQGGGVDAERQELEQLRARMTAIRERTAAEVDEKWGSPFRSKEMFDLKVKARLSGHHEYRKLQARVQQVEAQTGGTPDAAPEAGAAR